MPRDGAGVLSRPAVSGHGAHGSGRPRITQSTWIRQATDHTEGHGSDSERMLSLQVLFPLRTDNERAKPPVRVGVDSDRRPRAKRSEPVGVQGPPTIRRARAKRSEPRRASVAQRASRGAEVPDDSPSASEAERAAKSERSAAS